MSRPWMDDRNFPSRPVDGGAFGYRVWGINRGLADENELKRSIPTKLTRPGFLVWTPYKAQLLPPFEFDALHEVTKSAWQRTARQISRWVPLSLLFVVVTQMAPLFDPATPLSLFVQSAFVILSFTATSAFLVWDAMRSRRWTEHDEADIREGLRFIAWLVARPNFWRNVLGCTIIVTFFAQLVVDGLLPWPEPWLNRSIAAAGFSKILFSHGEWWRLITGSVLHHNFSHLLGNLIVMAANATAIAALASDALVPIVLLLGVVAGGLLSLVIYPTAISVGISGGLSAVAGFLLMILIRRRRTLPSRLLPWMLFSVWIGFAQDFAAWGHVDIAAHIGGFSAGFALGAVLIRNNEDSLPILVPEWLTRIGTACGVAFALTGLGVLSLFASALMERAGVT